MAAVEIHDLTEADLKIADQILVAAYGGASRAQRLQSYLALQPNCWLLARWQGAPAGVAGITHYGPTAYVGLVGVDPAYQRRGIARVMMEYIMRWAAEHGDPVLLLDASPAGAPLYEQLGFVDDEKAVMFRQDDCTRQPPISERVSLVRASDIPALAQFDAPIFGANRAAVFNLFRDEAPERAFVARDTAGRVCGYLFAQQSALGPWAARTAADAEALIGAALQLSYADGPFVITPSSNPDVSGLLLQYGFSPTRSLRHMRLGGAGPIGQRAQLYGLASFAIG